MLIILHFTVLSILHFLLFYAKKCILITREDEGHIDVSFYSWLHHDGIKICALDKTLYARRSAYVG